MYWPKGEKETVGSDEARLRDSGFMFLSHRSSCLCRHRPELKNELTSTTNSIMSNSILNTEDLKPFDSDPFRKSTYL